METTQMEPVETAKQEQPEAAAQSEIKRKMQFAGRVVNIVMGGALVDIGLDQPGFLHISRIKREPVNRVEDVLEVGQTVDVWVRRVDPTGGRVELTMIKPLDLEWREIKKGMVVRGKVSRIEKFGVFVEIGAERPGMIHISELTHGYIRNAEEVVKVGDEIEAQVLGVNRRKKRIKLSRKALEQLPSRPAEKEVDAPEIDEPVPTAMEIALREAMERAKDDSAKEAVQTERRKAKTRQELDEILSRTLEQQVNS